MTLEEVTIQIRQFRDDREWMQFHNPKDMAEAICIESAELLEHFLWKDPAQSIAVSDLKKQGISEEIADIAIYLIELADNLDAQFRCAGSDAFIGW